MNKKFSLGLMISLIAIACAITFVLTVTVSLNMFNQKIAGVSEREEIYTKIQEIDTYVRNKSLFKIKDDKLKENIVEGYINGLDDIAAEYFTADEYYRWQQVENGTIISTGLEVEAEESGYLRVSHVYKDSPAYSQNVKAGDVITSIGGTNLLDLSYEEGNQLLTGEEGSKINITYQRSGVESTISLTVRSFVIQSVYSEIVNGCGYVRIDSFNKQTAAQFEEIIKALQAQGVLGYVIDVRACGGVYDGVSQMLDMFMGEQVVANTIYADGSYQKFAQTTYNGEEISAPMVVLADENTSGPAELFAHSLNKYTGAQLVGKQTKGAYLATETRVFSDGSAVTISIAQVTLADGTVYSSGVKPDYAVDVKGMMTTEFKTLDNLTDEQLKKAFEVLESLK